MSPVTVLVAYQPKKGKEKAFLSILKRHWPALKKATARDADAPANTARD